MAKAAVAIVITVLVLACFGWASKHYAAPSCPAVLGQVSTAPPDARQAVHELVRPSSANAVVLQITLPSGTLHTRLIVS